MFSIDIDIDIDIYLPFFPIYLQFIHSLMYGEVTSRNHQAYSWGHLVRNNMLT